MTFPNSFGRELGSNGFDLGVESEHVVLGIKLGNLNESLF